MDTDTVIATNSRGNYPDGVVPFGNGNGMEHFWNGYGTDLAIPNGFREQHNPPVSSAGNDMFLNDFQPSDYATASFQPGYMPNTITPQATYSENQPQQTFTGYQQNSFGFTQQTAPQLAQNMQIDSDPMEFYLADGFSMHSTNDIDLAGPEPKSDTENEGGELLAPIKAKRGRRKGKKVLSEQEQAAKRQRFLARNRQAATKCRNRKKEWTQNLEDKAEMLGHKQQSLILQLKEIEEEKRKLQRQITEHASCGNPIIQEYLRAQAAAAANPTPRPQYTMMKTASQESERIFQGGMSPGLHMSTSQLDMRRRPSMFGSQGSFLDPAELSYQTLGELRRRCSSTSLQDSPRSNQSSSMSHEDPHVSRPHSVDMFRKVSCASTGSGITDSGVSNMGSPDKFNFESSHSDEGFASDGSIRMMSNPRHYGASCAAGPADLRDPQVYLRSFG
jgi:hypothetical protein